MTLEETKQLMLDRCGSIVETVENRKLFAEAYKFLCEAEAATRNIEIQQMYQMSLAQSELPYYAGQQEPK